MKGRTICPQCNHEFIMDVPDTSKTCEISCPKCNHKFAIRPNSAKPSRATEEYGWEEHGEPRKTILSSLKPRTTKPMIASFLLLASGILGIFTAVFVYSSDYLVIPYINLDLTFLIDMLSNIVLSIVIVVFSVFALVGFAAAFKRRYLDAAAIGAFLGIFSIGFFIGMILSLVALALIVVSREEFKHGTKGKVF